MLRHVAQLQFSACLAGAGHGADYGAESAAVNESDLTQMQHDAAAVAQQPGNVRPQSLALATCNNSPVAMHDGDLSDLTSVE
jgi:hypothetical protein